MSSAELSEEDLKRIAKMKGVKANLIAKLEFFNPIASVKDRIGVSMIDALEKSGKIQAGKTVLVEPTTQPATRPAPQPAAQPAAQQGQEAT